MKYVLSLGPDADRHFLRRAAEALEEMDGVKSVRVNARKSSLQVRVEKDGPDENALRAALDDMKIGASSPIPKGAAGAIVRRTLAWMFALFSVYLSLALILPLPLWTVLSYPVSCGIMQMALMLAVWALCAGELKPGARLKESGAPASYVFALLAALCAALYSLPALIGDAARVSRGEAALGRLFFSCAALLPVLMSLGRRTELRQRRRLKACLDVDEGFGKGADLPRCVKLSGHLGAGAAILALLLAISGVIFWRAMGESYAYAVSCALCVLAVACPGVPASSASLCVLRACARLAAMGAKVKDARALEQLGRAGCVLIREKGGLTDGKAEYGGCVLTSGMSEGALLSLAASALQNRKDASSLAIVEQAQRMSIPLDPILEEEGEGGCRALIGDTRVLVGDKLFLEKNALDASAWESRLQELSKQGCYGIFVVTAGQIQGLIGLRSHLREGSASVISKLHAQGIETQLLADSKSEVSQALGVRAGVDKVIYPEDAQMNQRLLGAERFSFLVLSEGEMELPAGKELRVCMSEGAWESARLVCPLSLLPDAVDAARGALSNLRRRLAIYVIVELISLPLALGLLHGRLDMSLSPLLASLIMLALNWLMLVGQKAVPTPLEN